MQIQVSQAAVATPFEAKEVRLQCPHCRSSVYVTVPWGIDSIGRQRLISEAIGEHRRLCSAAPPEATRVYEVSYPRV